MFLRKTHQSKMEEALKQQIKRYIGAYFSLFVILLLAACSSPSQKFTSTDDDVNIPMDEAPFTQDEDRLLLIPQIKGNNVYSDTIDGSPATPTPPNLVGSEGTPSQAVKTEIQPSKPESVVLNSGGLQFVEFFAFW